MPTPFATLEAKVNRAARDRLANAEAVINGQVVSGIYHRAYAEVINGLAAGANLLFECEEADVPGIAPGDAVLIGAEAFTVVSPESDGAGWVKLVLQRAV